MNRIALTATLLALAAACEGAADIDTDDTFDAAPDITGEYTATLSDAEGSCDAAALEAWAEGPLAITGTADSLLFDFGDGAAFDGSVDSSFFYELGAAATVGGLALDVFGDGQTIEAEGLWTLQGEIEAEDTASGCTRSATLTATQGSE